MKLKLIFILCLFCFNVIAEEHLMDASKKIENDGIVSAFKEYVPDSKASEERLKRELLKATFIVPYYFTEKPKKTESRRPNLFKEGDVFSFFNRKHKGGMVLSIATDWQGINKFLPFDGMEIKGWIMPANEVWDWVLKGDQDFYGVEILTSADAYTLPLSYISLLK